MVVSKKVLVVAAKWMMVSKKVLVVVPRWVMVSRKVHASGGGKVSRKCCWWCQDR